VADYVSLAGATTYGTKFKEDRFNEFLFVGEESSQLGVQFSLPYLPSIKRSLMWHEKSKSLLKIPQLFNELDLKTLALS